MEITNVTLHSARDGLSDKEYSSKELTSALLDNIQSQDTELSCYLHIDRAHVLKAAEIADTSRVDGNKAPLLGVPIAIKDNIATDGISTTCASRMLEAYVPPYDARVIEKLKSAGAFVGGKTNMDEFAMGSSTENSAFAQTKNPHDLARVPGGSSGGSAAAVASGLAIAALGSDTGGSIRQPASFCGVVGLKPSYGRVSRYGLVAMASSLDQIGVLTRNVKDAALLLSVIAGHDPRDATSSVNPVPQYEHELTKNVKGLKIGVPEEYFGEGMDADVRAKVEEALKTYERLGAKRVKISLPHTSYALAVYYILMPAEVSANLARFDGIRFGSLANEQKESRRTLRELYEDTRGKGFGHEVKRRIMLGTFVLAHGYYDAYYEKARRVRAKITADFINAFQKVDIIATPTSPTPAFKFGEKTSDPLTMYLSDIYTVSANLAGIPAISIPCGTVARDGKELPVGLQLMGKHFDESTLLCTAYAFESNHAHITRS